MEYGLGEDKTRLSVTSYGSVKLWGVDVIRDEGIGYREGRRKPCHIQAHPADDFLLCLPLTAQVRLEQAGVQTHFAAGSFAFLSTARPFSAIIHAEHPHAAFAHAIVRISAPLLRQRVARIDEYCGRPIAIRPGAGRIMKSLLELALQEGAALSDMQARRFSATLIDAIADAVLAAPEVNCLQTPTAQSAKLRLLDQAQHFVLANLSNPDLDADAIAKHCKVSVRYLRAAFAASPQTIGSFIREARLQQCRAALQNPALAGRSIMSVAMTWGFSDAAYFSRAYRTLFGLAPSAERNKTGHP
jgi:AraC-like DNA-binding protein